VIFVAHWCPHCQREVPLLATWMSGNPLPSNVEFRMVATATSSDRPNYPPSAWLAKYPLPGPVLVDSSTSEAAAAWGLPGYPYIVAVDPSGKVVDRKSGELPVAQFAQMVNEAAGTR
jgi:thiol-disulfide isomerase/thioredoxin